MIEMLEARSEYEFCCHLTAGHEYLMINPFETLTEDVKRGWHAHFAACMAARLRCRWCDNGAYWAWLGTNYPGLAVKYYHRIRCERKAERLRSIKSTGEG